MRKIFGGFKDFLYLCNVIPRNEEPTVAVRKARESNEITGRRRKLSSMRCKSIPSKEKGGTRIVKHAGYCPYSQTPRLLNSSKTRELKTN